jgi:molecular chaperone DnaK
MPQIEVTFDIDANGIMNVSAKDLGTSKEQKITITASSGLAKDEIDKMVKDAQSHSEEDRKRREEIEARNRLDSLIYASDRTFQENKAKLGPAEISQFEGALADARKALEAGGTANMNSAMERLQEASNKVAEVIYRGATAGAGGSSAESGAGAHEGSGSTSAGAGAGGGASGSGAGKEDEVIDTEYVDTEKS